MKIVPKDHPLLWNGSHLLQRSRAAGARALVRAVVLVVDRVGSLAVRVGRRWTIFCENLVGATKEARNRFVAHRLRLSLKASGFEAVGPAQHVEWSRAAAAVPDSTRRLYNSIAKPVSHCSTLTPCSASSASVSGHVFSRNCRPRLSTTTSGL